MNREILFRAKSSQSWCYGYVHKDYESPMPNKWRLTTAYGDVKVINSDTIGEWTGLLDKNNVMIFEGDILQGDEYPYCSDGDYNYYAEVVWFDDGCCGFGLCTHKNPKSAVRGISDGNCEWFEDFDSNNWSVVGNIYDNPELIEK